MKKIIITLISSLLITIGTVGCVGQTEKNTALQSSVSTSDGSSSAAEVVSENPIETSGATASETKIYILNIKTKKFHLPVLRSIRWQTATSKNTSAAVKMLSSKDIRLAAFASHKHRN